MDPRERHPYLALTCHAAPTIIQGTSPDGEDVVFRFRWGRAALEIDGHTVWNARYGDDYSGLIEEDDAFRLVAALLDARAAHAAILAKLPVTPTAPLDPEGQAWIDSLTAPARD